MYLYNIHIVFLQEIFRDGSSILNTATEGRAHFGQVIDIFCCCVFSPVYFVVPVISRNALLKVIIVVP